MASSSNTAILATGAALLAASVGLGYMSLSKSTEITEIDETTLDMITEQDVVQVFDKLFLESQNKVADIMKQIQQLRAMGQDVIPSQLAVVFRAELTQTITQAQQRILQQMKIDADCFEEATWELIEAKNSNVERVVTRLQKVWQNSVGDHVVGWRPGQEVKEIEPLSPDATIRAAQTYFDALTELMKTVMAEFKDKGKDLKQSAVQQELNMEFAKRSNDVGSAALETIQTTLEQFETSVQAHQNNTQVTQAIAMIHMNQQQQFARMTA